MSKSILNSLITVIITVLLIAAYHFFFNTKKIGYVKTGVLLSDYKAMVIANEQFSKEMLTVQSNIDTLRLRYERLKSLEQSASGKDKATLNYNLGVAENEFSNYNTLAEKQMQQRKQELTSKVLASVNNYIQQYGKDNNYEIIFGTTTDGSILYGTEKQDLTQIILAKLNEDYK